ncbi:hypothetical protein D3C73_1513320 [compost metagenome]
MTAPVTVPPAMVTVLVPSPTFSKPVMNPEFMITVSAPAPKVTLPLIEPVPLAGNVRVLLPAVSVKGPLLPLSQVKLSLPAVGARVQAADVIRDSPAHSNKVSMQAE